jgi:hypothetical protein
MGFSLNCSELKSGRGKMSKNAKTASMKTVPVTYASLINNKVAIISSTTPYFAVEQHFFYNLMESYLSRIYVDEQWYLNTYPDIRDAVSNGAASSAAEHFRRFGYYEHRKPYQINVDEAWYLEAYPDVKSAIDAGHFTSAQNHFDVLGYKEGRIPFANFALQLGQE